jgi:hypothetical protein
MSIVSQNKKSSKADIVEKNGKIKFSLYYIENIKHNYKHCQELREKFSKNLQISQQKSRRLKSEETCGKNFKQFYLLQKHIKMP